MVDTPPQPASDQPMYSTDPNGNKTISVNGKVYTVMDIGFLNGNPNSACLVLSDNTIVVSPIPDGAPVCSSCWHVEGVVLVPDYEICGEAIGPFGTLIKFKSAWECHCLQMMGYVSVDMTLIDPTMIFPAMCGLPKVPPPIAP